MPAAGLSRRPWWATERPDRALVRAAAWFAAGAIAVVVAVALLVWALAPASWQSLIVADQRTDATALTVISIWANNLLICCVPVLGGVFAHRLARGGRRGWARVVLATAGLSVVRSLLVVGIVGGLDPAWLVTAVPWWTVEIAALSACCAAGWLALSDADARAASRRLAHALTFATGALALAAAVEVALT